MVNSHSSNLNRIAVMVYDNTHGTVETITTIDGSGGDVCSGSYGYTSLYRPAWVGSNLTLRFYATYWNSDTEFRISTPSFIRHG